MRKKLLIIAAACLFITLGFLMEFLWMKAMNDKTLYRLKEPMLISTSKDDPYYMLPTNTVLHYQRGYAEGHQLYTIEVFAKGALPANKLPPNAVIESTWVYPIEAEDVSELMHKYPLSKADLVRILKARKMTRDDLAQIIREWKDD